MPGINVISTNGSLLAEMTVNYLRERGLEVYFFPKVMKLRHDALSEVELPENFPVGNVTFVMAEYSQDANREVLEMQLTLHALGCYSCTKRYAVYPFFLTNKFGRGNPVAHRGVGFQYIGLRNYGCRGLVTVEIDTQQVRDWLREMGFENLSWQPMLAEYLLTKGYFDAETVIFAPTWVVDRYQLLAGRLQEARAGELEMTSLQTSLETGAGVAIWSLPREVMDPEARGLQQPYLDFLAQAVPGKKVLLLDFVLNTGVTLAHAVHYFRDLGVKEITVALPHVIGSGTLEELRRNMPDRLIVSNTTGQAASLGEIANCEVLDITPLMGETIRQIAEEYAAIRR